MAVNSLPLVSLAIPVYNGSNFLRFAIDSALAQDYPNIEIIVVNDGSDDRGETEEIALSYGKRIQYFSKENGGVASALNLALCKSNGEYFCWLSHDDQYLPKKVSAQVAFLDSLPSSDAVVFCRYKVINEKGELLYEPLPPPSFDPQTTAYQLLLGQWLHCCTVLTRRSIFLEMGGFREDLPTTQDYDLLVKIGLHYPFFELPEVLLLARSHPEQGSLTLYHQAEVEKFFDDHIPLLSSEYMCRCFGAGEISSAWATLGVKMRERGFIQAAVSVCRQIFKCEICQSNPQILFNAIQRVTYNRHEAEQWQARAVQLSIELGQQRPLVEEKTMDLFKAFMTRIRRRLIATISGGKSHEIFNQIYETNFWRGESRSGEGSDLIQTALIRKALPDLLRDINAKSMLDIPCGDFYWMQHVNVPTAYIGADIVEKVVKINNEKYAKENRKFVQLDVCNDELPKVDLIFARDLLVHLSFADIRHALHNMKDSGSTWLLTTTFTNRDSNEDIETGDWRTLNLQLAPFTFPEPERLINEGCTQFNGDYNDKCLGLWKLSEINI